MYEPLNLQLPNGALWIGIFLTVVGLAVIAHALWRRGRYRKAEATGVEPDARYAGPDRIVDAGRQVIAGVVVGALGVASIVLGVVARNDLESSIDQNMAQKYGTEEVVGQGWQGNALIADVTMPDGTVYEDVLIRFGDDGEPTVSEDALTPAP